MDQKKNSYNENSQELRLFNSFSMYHRGVLAPITLYLTSLVIIYNWKSVSFDHPPAKQSPLLQQEILPLFLGIWYLIS